MTTVKNNRLYFATKREVDSFFDPEWESFTNSEKKIIKEQLLEVFYKRSIKADISKKLSEYIKRKTEFLNKSGKK